MLLAGGLDAVLVAAPSTLHLGLVERIADAGLPILCEKPCGITAQQAREAASIAERRNVKLQVAYWRRFVPALQRLRRRIVDGEMGALYFLACYQWDGEPPPVQFHAGSGGIFVDMGVHVRSDPLAERPEFSAFPCRMVFWRWFAAGDTESAQALCTLSGGSTALVSLGRRFPLGEFCRVEVFGTRDAEDCRFLWPPDGEQVFMQALRRQAESFATWVRGGDAEGATADDAVAALQAAEQATAALAR
jgi:myo-inositol 2-dehydrogenase/D-chiro-inositol 1-dehydrogenase